MKGALGRYRQVRPPRSSAARGTIRAKSQYDVYDMWLPSEWIDDRNIGLLRRYGSYTYLLAVAHGLGQGVKNKNEPAWLGTIEKPNR